MAVRGTSWLLVLALMAVPWACDRSGGRSGGTTSAAAAPANGPKPEVVAAPAALDDGRRWVKGEQERARRDGRILLLYVGATWCEPCRRFHDAVLAGQLDRELAGVRLLELDADRHARALAPGDLDCVSSYIPLFARPTAEGTCGRERVAGAIKGAGAVAFLLPKLRRLLGR